MRVLKIIATMLVSITAWSLVFQDVARAELKEVQLEKANAKVGRRQLKGTLQALPQWIIKAGQIYMEQDNAEAAAPLLKILEDNLGIQKDGQLNPILAWDSKCDLAGYEDFWQSEWQEKAPWLYYLKDKFSLTGFNHLYFELCTQYQEAYGDRFVRYFENGFYPHKQLFSKNANYYQILYYYLYLTSKEISDLFSQATTYLNAHPGKSPPFLAQSELQRFNLAVSVSAELDMFISKAMASGGARYDEVFSEQERRWIKGTTDYFLSTQTHSALLSYDWFRRNMPLAASAEAVSYGILRSWEEQAVMHRTRLPLMFFAQNGGGPRVSIETLFEATLRKLRLDNRKVDIMVLTALETWLSKQVRRGIKIEDRIKYNNILAELKACPSGWIFANLYDCRSDLARLKDYAEKWRQEANPQKRFETEVMETFFQAKEKIDAIFNDFEKIFGQSQEIGQVNYIFPQYRGEVIYYFKYLQFETFKGKGAAIPAAGPEANYLNDFKTAFVAAPKSRQNHINLLNGYNLLFRKLLAAGRINEIQKRERELETFVRGRYALGSILPHKDNNLYDTYRVLTYAYLSYENLETRALEAAQKGFALAKSYYRKAAREAGYTAGGKIGAITWDNTEMDDYQRQFELYKTVANKLGKKIRLLVSDDDVRLYNKMQEMRKLGKYSL